MSVIGSSGDTKISWDSTKPAEVDAARDHFKKLTSKGFRGYRVKASGLQGSEVKDFDPELENILMIPPQVGG